MTAERKSAENTYSVKIAPEHSVPLRKAGDTHKNGITGFISDLVDQYFNKRKLGCYIHEDAHTQEVDRLNRRITTLEGQMLEINDEVFAFASLFGLEIEDAPLLSQALNTIRNKATDTLKAAETYRSENEAYVKQITELKETTLPKTEHEELIASALKSKEGVEKQLETAQASVTRLEGELSESQTSVQTLERQNQEQESTLGTLRNDLEIAQSDIEMCLDHYRHETRKPLYLKIWEHLTGQDNSPLDEDRASSLNDASQEDKDDA